MTTVFELVSQSNKTNSNTVIMTSSDGMSYKMKHVYNDILKVSKSLIYLGLIPIHESVSIFSWNSPEWIITALAAIIAGGKVCTIHFNSTRSRCEYVLKDSLSRVIFVDTKERLDIAIKAKKHLPRLKAIVVMNDTLTSPHEYVYNWKQFVELGVKIRDEILNERISFQKPNDCCMLVYTSGTTGNPKGVMLSHDNITWTARAHMEHNPIFSSEPMRVLSFLPLSHIAPIMFELFVPFTCMSVYNQKATIFFAKSSSIGVKELTWCRPTVIFAVPRTWEKLAGVAKEIEAGLDGFLYRIMKQVCVKSHDKRQDGGHTKLNFIDSVARRYMNNGIKKFLGMDKVQLCFTGAAPPNIGVVKYFAGLGIDIVGAYGMSELSGSQCFSKPHMFIDGFSGLPVPGTEVKVDELTGELCFRGRQVMLGYHGETTPCVDEDNWFHSGDTGEIHKNGYIKINGRVDDTIITSYGKNIMPTVIESYLCERCEDVENAIVVGNNMKYLGLLVTLKPNGDVNNIYKCLKEYNKTTKSTKADKIKKIVVVRGEFSVSGGELTPSNKLRRSYIIKKYENEIKAMYLDLD